MGKMKYKQNEKDRFYMSLVEKYLKMCCVYHNLVGFNQDKQLCYFYDKPVAEFKFKKWSAKVDVDRPAHLHSLIPEKDVQRKDNPDLDPNIFKNDEELYDVLYKYKTCKLISKNKYVYYIEDPDGNRVTEPKLVNDYDFFEPNLYIAIRDFGENICNDLKKAYYDAHPDEYAEKMKPVKLNWEF